MAQLETLFAVGTMPELQHGDLVGGRQDALSQEAAAQQRIDDLRPSCSIPRMLFSRRMLACSSHAVHRQHKPYLPCTQLSPKPD